MEEKVQSPSKTNRSLCDFVRKICFSDTDTLSHDYPARPTAQSKHRHDLNEFELSSSILRILNACFFIGRILFQCIRRLSMSYLNGSLATGIGLSIQSLSIQLLLAPVLSWRIKKHDIKKMSCDDDNNTVIIYLITCSYIIFYFISLLLLY